MTFTRSVKDELCRNEYNNSQKKAILSSFLKNIVTIKISKNVIQWEIKIKTPIIIRFIFLCLKEIYNIEKELTISKKINNKIGRNYILEFSGNFKYIENDLCIFSDPNSILISNETKSSYLIGAFLSSGSINNPLSSNYHFEIKFNNIDLFMDIKKILSFFKIEYSTLKRNNYWLIYVKKSENISDLLKILGANNSMFEYEDKRISRDYTNQLSRLNNLDLSNLKKTTKASINQIYQIEFLKKNNHYNDLNIKEKIFCDIRLKNPYASFNEIANIFLNEYKILISRTGINHIVRKIKKIYEMKKTLIK